MAEASEQRKPRSEASKELKRVAVFKKLEQGSSVVDSWRGRLGTVVESGSVKYHDDTLVRSSIGPLEISVASTGSIAVRFVQAEGSGSAGSEIAIDVGEDNQLEWQKADQRESVISFYHELRPQSDGRAVIQDENVYGFVRREGQTYMLKTNVNGQTDDWLVDFKIFNVTGRV